MINEIDIDGVDTSKKPAADPGALNRFLEEIMGIPVKVNLASKITVRFIFIEIVIFKIVVWRK